MHCRVPTTLLLLLLNGSSIITNSTSILTRSVCILYPEDGLRWDGNEWVGGWVTEWYCSCINKTDSALQRIILILINGDDWNFPHIIMTYLSHWIESLSVAVRLFILNINSIFTHSFIEPPSSMQIIHSWQHSVNRVKLGKRIDPFNGTGKPRH